MRELIALEVSGGTLRTFSEEVVLNETLSRLIKRSKEADEESGTKILYLALGFLKWYSREDGKEKYAPLVLKPVALKKGKGGVGYAVASTDEEFSVNSTLLEFLKQEFNIDIRGLDGALQGLKISEILAMIRMEIVNMKVGRCSTTCMWRRSLSRAIRCAGSSPQYGRILQERTDLLPSQ